MAAVAPRGNLKKLSAMDSVPAIFVVTKDPFIIFTRNTFAIPGLRSLDFLQRSTVTIPGAEALSGASQ
jgi:hypothetical protein